jgi:hypothetical protein
MAHGLLACISSRPGADVSLIINGVRVNPHQLGVNSRGAEIMAQVVPAIIHLMMNDYQWIWAKACYSVVE